MEGFGQFLPIILLFTAMYFLFLLPQSRKAKKEKQFVSNIKNGDRVVTKSGMHGKIVEINDANNTCVLITMAGKIKFDKSAISFELSDALNKKA
jgi:preprotein translocase subunit YajC|tara:strand:+ start:325 stop:606 length:282 start_codon:yes stop_codon:yes gene_type:complete